MKTVRLSIVGALALVFVQCGGSGDTGSSRSALESKCAKMCAHLVAAPLLGCGKSDGTSIEVCKPECVSHLTPKAQGEAPEADLSDLECATTAPDCESWNACGDLL